MSHEAKVVYDNVTDSSGLSGQLFKGIKFWIAQRVPSRSRFVDLVKQNGGHVVQMEKLADYLIVDHIRKDTTPGGISYRFIEDSIKQGTLADPEDHITGPAKGTVRAIGSTRPTKSTKVPYTAEDDLELYAYVKQIEANGGAISGNEIYKELETKNPRHTWQSWRHRYIKYLAYKPPSGYDPANVPSSPPPSHSSEPNSTPRKPTSKSKNRRSIGSAQRSVDNASETSREIAERFDSRDYWELYVNYKAIENTLYVEAIDAWEGWSEGTPQTSQQWRQFWEEVVYVDLKRDESDGTRDSKFEKYQALINEERSQSEQNQENSSQRAVRFEDAANTLDADALHQPRGGKKVSQYMRSPRPAIKVSPRKQTSRTRGDDSQATPTIQSSSPRSSKQLKRSLEDDSMNPEIEETQSQDLEPSSKRVKYDENGQFHTTRSAIGDVNTTDIQAAQPIVISLSDDGSEEVDDANPQNQAHSNLFPDGILDQQQAMFVSQIDDLIDIDSYENSAKLVASQTNHVSGSLDLEPEENVEAPSNAKTRTSQSLSTPERRRSSRPRTEVETYNTKELTRRSLTASPKAVRVSQPLISPTRAHRLVASTKKPHGERDRDSLFVQDDESVASDQGGAEYHSAKEGDDEEIVQPFLQPAISLDSPISKGGWGPSSDEELDVGVPNTPTPRRPVYDTQAILAADTQDVDFEIPDPPEIFEDEDGGEEDPAHQQRHDSRESSVATDVSEAPLDGSEIKSIAKQMQDNGYSISDIVQILKCTSNYRRLVNIVLESVKKGEGIPTDVPGIWTAEDDQALDERDSRAFKRLDEKHGWGRVLERIEFLKHYRR